MNSETFVDKKIRKMAKKKKKKKKRERETKTLVS